MSTHQSPSSPSRKPRAVLALRILGILYALAAALVFLMNQKVIQLLNFAPERFQTFEALPLSEDPFWVVLASGLLVTLSALSFLSAQFPKHQGYLLTHFFSKLATLVSFLHLFFNHQKFFAYLLAAGIDLAILGVLIFAMISQSLGNRRTRETGSNVLNVSETDLTSEPQWASKD